MVFTVAVDGQRGHAGVVNVISERARLRADAMGGRCRSESRAPTAEVGRTMADLAAGLRPHVDTGEIPGLVALVADKRALEAVALGTQGSSGTPMRRESPTKPTPDMYSNS